MTVADMTYEPAYTPSQRHRLHQLCGPAKWIFEEVLNSMQHAEALGGPEGSEYVALMEAIIQEAAERREYVRLTLG
ncbi:MAG: hypothetical protein IT432_04875 [Phycisphaerales bacterium]|nr:hypothetical protein [Phycisphaerales bacterium]